MLHEAALPGKMLPQEQADETTQETTPGDEQEVRWEVVAVTQGLMKASIIGGRLEAEGIPTQVWQEPAGVAIGLTVGRLGEAKVLVPEPLAEQALDILNQADQESQ